MTVREALQAGTAHLSKRADLRENASRDAQQILEIAAGITRVQMLSQPDRPLAEEEQGSFFGMVAQRYGAVPIQHLRGSQEFFGRDFLVTPDVLIPRPETEHLIEEVFRLHPERSTPLRIADVGTGSGILAVTLALEYPRSSILALDISPEALAVAHRNAIALNARNVRFATSDLLAGAENEIFDLIVSNPPYIPLTEAAALHPQVRDHEPHLALFGGEDGHGIYRALIPQAKAQLASGGWLVLETAGRFSTLDALLQGWSEPRYATDLQGIDRIATARNGPTRPALRT